MYSDKKSVLQLVALLKAHNVRQIVLCPGSRNAPIVQSISNDSYFKCVSVTDERSAGYVAMGMALNGGKPAAVCCTSGTALLNIHPAIAEAYYQQIPLVVISGDRPVSAIGQMQGQTIPQANVFQGLVKMSVNLPEVNSEAEELYCNRLVNEALLALYHHGRGPVHINVPISEPLFNFSIDELPKVRVIKRFVGLNEYNNNFEEEISRINLFTQRMVVAGQEMMIYLFDKETERTLSKNFVWLSEYMGNQTTPTTPIHNFDTMLYAMGEEEQKKYSPDLLITYGGHIVSKRLKEYFKKYPPREHWHVAADGKVVDTYGCLTTVFEVSPFEFLEKIAPYIINRKGIPNYINAWVNRAKTISEPNLPYSSIGVVGALIRRIGDSSVLHLANSSVVRYAQLYNVSKSVEICCNRGTSGIEGSLSTAIGYAQKSDKLNYVLIGDLSFFYDMNGVWSRNYGSNFRVLLINNSGGEIFKALPMNLTDTAQRYVTAYHQTKAEGWAKECGFTYLSASNEEELREALGQFTNPDFTQSKPMFLEVFTDSERDVEIYKSYFRTLKQ